MTRNYTEFVSFESTQRSIWFRRSWMDILIEAYQLLGVLLPAESSVSEWSAQFLKRNWLNVTEHLANCDCLIMGMSSVRPWRRISLISLILPKADIHKWMCPSHALYNIPNLIIYESLPSNGTLFPRFPQHNLPF